MISDKNLRKIAELLRKADQCSDEYDAYAECIWELFTMTYRDALSQLVNCGPVEDGNVISKSYRDELITLGLAGRVVVKGQQGFTGANYDGWAVYKAGQK